MSWNSLDHLLAVYLVGWGAVFLSIGILLANNPPVATLSIATASAVGTMPRLGAMVYGVRPETDVLR